MNVKFIFALPLCALSSGAYAIYGHNQLNAALFDWVGIVSGGGSGTVISPHFVMTAKHVGGLGFSLNGTNYTAIERIDHPTADVSLLRFTNTFTKYSKPWLESVVGQALTFVGFGDTATERTSGGTAWTGYDYVANGGTRRAATNRIERVEDVAYFVGGPTTTSLEADLDSYDPRTPAAYQIDYLGGGGPLANEGGLLFGDSGGGSLIQINGEWRIAGVNIWIDDTNGVDVGNNNDYLDYGDIFGAVSVQAYGDWIGANAPESVPEPATMSALSFGLLMFLRKRQAPD